MAERRMFTEKITESDVFLEMPLSSQCFYFHLCMHSDDEGFVKNPRRIQRMVGASDDDFKVLIAKHFVLIYESGIIVIKHWKMHNLIRKDRFHPSEYIEEKSMLYIKENGAYTFDPMQGKPLLTTNRQPTDNQLTTKSQPTGNQLATEVRLGKDSIDKDKYNVCFEEFWKAYPRKKEKAKAYKCYQSRLKDGYSEEELLEACKNYASDCENTQREERYIKLGATFLSSTTPFVDYLNKNYVPEKKTGAAKFGGFNQRKYDYDALMNEVVNKGES